MCNVDKDSPFDPRESSSQFSMVEIDQAAISSSELLLRHLPFDISTRPFHFKQSPVPDISSKQIFTLDITSLKDTLVFTLLSYSSEFLPFRQFSTIKYNSHNPESAAPLCFDLCKALSKADDRKPYNQSFSTYSVFWTERLTGKLYFQWQTNSATPDTLLNGAYGTSKSNCPIASQNSFLSAVDCISFYSGIFPLKQEQLAHLGTFRRT